MEVRIGIRENGRDISFESSQDPTAIAQLVNEALAGTMLQLTDSKGKQILVPSNAIAYVDIGVEEGRRVGFIA